MNLVEEFDPGLKRTLGRIVAEARGQRNADYELVAKTAHEEDIRGAISREWAAPVLPIAKEMIDPTLISKLDAALMVARRFIPVTQQNSLIVVATSRPWNVQARDAVVDAFHTQAVAVSMVYVTDANLQQLFELLRIRTEDYHETAKEVATRIEASNDMQVARLSLDNAPSSDLQKVFFPLLKQAIDRRANDLHLHPDPQGNYRVRLEINGMLHDEGIIPKGIAISLENIIYNLTLTMKPDRRIFPQDGNIQIEYAGQTIDCRLASLPTYAPGTACPSHITIRLQNSVLLADITLDKLGFDQDTLMYMRRSVASPGSFCVVSGPTGSGKTTTLGSCLKYLNSPDRMIYSVEEPVENFIPGVCHIQVQKQTPFADVLRSLLRKKPDVIMVGEIRDEETANVAMQAAMTGHTVLTTVHADYAYEVPLRLSYIGVKPYQVAQKLELCSSQRLIKTLCDHCADEMEIDAQMVKEFNLPESFAGTRVRVRNNHGCSKCQGGYTGRKPIIEVIPLDDAMRDMVANEATASALKNYSEQTLKVVTLRDKALSMLAMGQTDLGAIRQVIRL